MHHKTINESNFIGCLRKKDERALDYVVDTYGGLIKSIVRRHLFEYPDKCEECMNDILLTIWNQISRFDQQKNTFSGWLAAVCKYKAIDYHRKYRRQALEIPLSEDEMDLHGAPETEMESSEELQTLLQMLSDEDRSLFWNCYVKEKSLDEIAKERKVNISVLYNRISRGRKKMKHYREAHL